MRPRRPSPRTALAIGALGVGLWRAAGAVFLRDPERSVPLTTGTALAPADGRVVHVGPVWDSYWGQEMLEIAVFLAVWDVHIQRVPLDGEVVAQQRKKGGYRPAMSRAAAHGNNQLATYLRTPAGPCTITQISGLVARRLVAHVGPGDRVRQGERLGLIRLGSQTTVRLPLAASALVRPGDRVLAGITPVARLQGSPTEQTDGV